jgi:hypothetical protein
MEAHGLKCGQLMAAAARHKEAATPWVDQQPGPHQRFGACMLHLCGLAFSSDDLATFRCVSSYSKCMNSAESANLGACYTRAPADHHVLVRGPSALLLSWSMNICSASSPYRKSSLSVIANCAVTSSSPERSRQRAIASQAKPLFNPRPHA